MKKDDYPTVNFESYNVALSETYDEGISGPVTCAVSFGGDWDAHTNPLGNPPGLYPRDDLAALLFYPSRIDSVPWVFAYARLRSANNSAEIKGKVAFDCSGMNQGPFSFPQGSV